MRTVLGHAQFMADHMPNPDSVIAESSLNTISLVFDGILSKMRQWYERSNGRAEVTIQSILVNKTEEVVLIFDDFELDIWFDEESKECLDQRREIPSPKSKRREKEKFGHYFRSMP